ncbi:hypothetical protein GJ496_008985 [Pomphorhynchus laevis]|nr:hypothetical protein GJ496_008985 [Pomphorhynchus laevis]
MDEKWKYSLLAEELSWKNRSFRQVKLVGTNGNYAMVSDDTQKELNVSIRKITRFPEADKDTQEQNKPAEYASQLKELCSNGPADPIDNNELNQSALNLPEINLNNESSIKIADIKPNDRDSRVKSRPKYLDDYFL